GHRHRTFGYFPPFRTTRRDIAIRCIFSRRHVCAALPGVALARSDVSYSWSGSAHRRGYPVYKRVLCVLFAAERNDAMRSLILNLTPRGEVLLVFAIWFGLGIIMRNIGGHLTPGSQLHGEFSSLGQMVLAIYELLVLALVFFYIGRIRGWSFASFGFQISCKLTGLGVLLFVPAKLIFVLRKMIVGPNTALLPAGQIALPIIIISSIITGIFEELMEVGYVIKVTEKHGMWTAVFISALIRTVLHVYQGAAGMACVFVIGITFGLVYWKLRQLWPLIVAHILIDIIGSLWLTHQAT